MRISIRDLEEVRKDPIAYKKKRESPSPGFGFKSRHTLLQHAVRHFHRHQNVLPEAKRYLTQKHSEQFKSQKELPCLVEQLEDYAAEFSSLGFINFSTRTHLILPLPTELSANFTVSGLIPRVDLTPTGYAAWIFAKESSNWVTELRLPLIQSAYATALDAELDEIMVGVYDFSKASHWSHTYTSDQVMAAHDELTQLLQAVS